MEHNCTTAEKLQTSIGLNDSATVHLVNDFAMLLKCSVRYISFSTSAMQSFAMPAGLEGRSASGCFLKISSTCFSVTEWHP